MSVRVGCGSSAFPILLSFFSGTYCAFVFLLFFSVSSSLLSLWNAKVCVLQRKVCVWYFLYFDALSRFQLKSEYHSVLILCCQPAYTCRGGRFAQIAGLLPFFLFSLPALMKFIGFWTSPNCQTDLNSSKCPHSLWLQTYVFLNQYLHLKKLRIYQL